MNNTTWKRIALDEYRRVEHVIALLDFNYSIEEADCGMKNVIEKMKIDFKFFSETINGDDIWKKMVEEFISKCESALNEKDEFRRKERYYGCLNYVTDFIEINDTELV